MFPQMQYQDWKEVVKETWKERFLFVSSHFNVSEEGERERERERENQKGLMGYPWSRNHWVFDN